MRKETGKYEDEERKDFLKLMDGIMLGSTVSVLTGREDCQVLKMENETGEGFMTFHELFPGVVMMNNDFHMEYCMSEFQANGRSLLCIDHCREGSIAKELDEDTCMYLENGDLCVDVRRYHEGRSDYPVKHYHGISIGFFLPEAEEQLPKELKDFSVSLCSIQEKFCKNEKPYIIKASPEIEHIFSELYRVPERIKKDYFRIKVFELLLYLDALELSAQKKEKPYFYKSQVERIRAVQKLLTEHLDTTYTIEELSERTGLSQTTLKTGFKALYGKTIYGYIQNYRMNAAAGMLKQEQNKSVADIAAEVGYESPSKFAAAFKKIIGMTPLEYRKRKGI